MIRTLRTLTLALALLLGAAGVAVGIAGMNDAHHAAATARADRSAAASALTQAKKADTDAAAAQQSATNALDQLPSTSTSQPATLCNTTAIKDWNTTASAAAQQALADGNQGAYNEYELEAGMVDLVCGTNFAVPHGA